MRRSCAAWNSRRIHSLGSSPHLNRCRGDEGFEMRVLCAVKCQRSGGPGASRRGERPGASDRERPGSLEYAHRISEIRGAEPGLSTNWRCIARRRGRGVAGVGQSAEFTMMVRTRGTERCFSEI
jgi:hypothetical protein